MEYTKESKNRVGHLIQEKGDSAIQRGKGDAE